MNRTISWILLLLALVFIVSCTTNHKVALSQNKGVVGKNGIPRPDWVIYDQSNDTTHYVAGFGTGTTFEVAKQKATLNADADIAIWVSDSVKAVRDRYIEESAVNSSTSYIDKFVSTATEMGKAVLSGVKEIDFWEDGEGGVWVLRSIPVANVKAQIDAAINETCSDLSLFNSSSDVSEVMAKLEKALDEYFPTK